MEKSKVINVGIGFATGRKSFQKVLKTYAYSWRECGLAGQENVKLHLLVAYDLQYFNTRARDYKNIKKDVRDILDETFFIGTTVMLKEINELCDNLVLTKEEQSLFFPKGMREKETPFCIMP
jgi:hypothetical protein